MGTHLGTNAWVSFVAGPTMFMNMERHKFGDIQARLFPKLGMASYQLAHPQPDLLLGLLATSTLSHAINSFVLFPLTTKLQYERRTAKPSNMKKISMKFNVMHSLSVLVNFIGMAATVYYFYLMGDKVAGNW